MRAESWYARLVPVLLPLAQVGLTGSIYLTLAISVERYTTVVHPFFRLARAWTARHYVLPTAVFALAYNVPKVGKLQSGGVFRFQLSWDCLASLPGWRVLNIQTAISARVFVSFNCIQLCSFTVQ